MQIVLKFVVFIRLGQGLFFVLFCSLLDEEYVKNDFSLRILEQVCNDVAVAFFTEKVVNDVCIIRCDF